MTRVVIVDIDGTVAHHTPEMRGHFEYDKVGKDTPIEPIVDLVNLFAFSRLDDGDEDPEYAFEIVFLSGREDSCRDLTEAWLRRTFPYWLGPEIVPIELYMRPTGDHRKDDVLKRELYEAHIAPSEVAYVLEDRNRNVTMWRSLGLTCLQVADGDF